jgi:hypothetical protein
MVHKKDIWKMGMVADKKAQVTNRRKDNALKRDTIHRARQHVYSVEKPLGVKAAAIERMLQPRSWTLTNVSPRTSTLQIGFPLTK